MQNVKTFFRMFHQLIWILDKKQRRDGVILFFLMLIVSLLELLGVGVILPFIVTMMEPDKIMENKYAKIIFELFQITEYQHFLYVVVGLIVVVYILKNGFILFVNYFQSNFRNKLDRDLSVKMLRSYLQRPYPYFLSTNSAEILRGVNSDMTNVAAVVDGFSGVFSEGLTCSIIGIFLLLMNPFMAIALLLIAALSALGIMVVFRKKTSESGEVCRKAFGEKIKDANQSVNGIKDIIVANKRKYFVDQYEVAADTASRYNTRYLWISKLPNRLIETVFIGGFLIVVVVSYGMSSNNATFISQLAAMAMAAIRILPSISNLTVSMNALVYFRPSLEAAYENLHEVEKYEGLELTYTSKEDKITFQEKISIKNIDWKYREDLPQVLQNASFEIKKGESIGLIGESGAGKSTMADIILGLLRPQKGQILIDEYDVYENLSQWSELIGYVPQMVYLLDDTVRNNVAFGVPQKEIDEDKLWNALEQAQLRDVVQKLENGLDTIVGEKGIKLSGGQRQRIAIARALYHNPEILIMDEATSALDNETEKAVMEAIEMLQGKMTLIIIAHRLTTIQNCDHIYEIKDKKAILRSKEEIFG